MKKLLFFFINVLILVVFVNGQTVLYQNNFEAYNAGGFLVQQAGAPWATWSNAPGGSEDAVISTAEANSPTKSVYISSTSDDIVLKLGNKTSGKYSVKFFYYIPTGKGAYFNIQHFEAPGVEWAIEVYFGNNGTGQSSVNSVLEQFAHPLDTWMEIESIVDLDLDSAWLYVDNLFIRAWKFSMQSNAASGTKQLGAINFYGGALTGQTPLYYFDDVTFTQINAGSNPPDISLSTTTIATDGTSNEVFTISNLGDQQMNFITYAIYPEGSKQIKLPQIDGQETAKLSYTEIDPRQIPQFETKSDKINELSYVTGALTSGMGFGGNVTVRSAVKFDYNFIKPFIGRELTQITIGVYDLPTGNTKIQIYDRGSFSTPGAGNIIAEKAFSVPSTMSEVTVTLDNPIFLDGNDIWLGWICDATGGTYPIGLDPGPRIPGINWISTGPGWTEPNPTIDNNIYVLGTLQGSSVYQWLSVSPPSGIVNGGGQQTITASFNTTGMVSGNYLAKIVIGCNDQTQEYSEVDVHLTIGASINEVAEKVAVMTFPNPVTDLLNINTNSVIESVAVYSLSGQNLQTYRPQTRDYAIPVSGLAKGLYIIVITTPSEQFEHRFVVE